MTNLKGFLSGLGRYMVSWWGFVFTVAGTAVGLALAKEYWWIALLIILANALGCGFFSYAKHRGEAQAKAERREAVLKLQEAERRLNEVPLGLLDRVGQMVNSVSTAALARLLVNNADVIARYKQFVQEEAKPLALTTFARQGDQLFVLAKASVTALKLLRVGDPFQLRKKTPSGLEFTLARMEVHQLPDLKKEVAYFIVLGPIPQELQPMADLAIHGDVAGVKGYAVRPAYDVARYATLDLCAVRVAIALLIEDIAR